MPEHVSTELHQAVPAEDPSQHKRRDDPMAAARVFPPLDSSARNLYQEPLLITEQEARAEQDATDRWQDEGGYCPGTAE